LRREGRRENEHTDSGAPNSLEKRFFAEAARTKKEKKGVLVRGVSSSEE